MALIELLLVIYFTFIVNSVRKELIG